MTIEMGKKGKHIPGNNNIMPGGSKFTHPDPQGLVDKLWTKAEPSSASKLPLTSRFDPRMPCSVSPLPKLTIDAKVDDAHSKVHTGRTARIGFIGHSVRGQFVESKIGSAFIGCAYTGASRP